ncbi:DUF858-domain-containing protein [Violaceomyces palustris]|uniref:DUF858-domain-containing protein n=1 Tax=Violaceomyces palustris TaxID=1673888 RepID=A0ACD0P114_9BASI|nr:DUF858-domain-containing protein [Violaceomyces palustris]
MSAIRVIHPNPDVKRGVEYWEGVPSTVDGVLGGFGHVSRADSLGSRSFLLKILPRLSSIPPASYNCSPEEWLEERLERRGGKGKSRTRALDCGAGVGRVSEHSLLPIVDEVHLVEPVEKFLLEAKKLSTQWAPLTTPPSSSPFRARKAAHFHCSTLQDMDPSIPYSSCKGKGKQIEPTLSVSDEEASDEVEEGEGRAAGSKEEPLKFDVVWCQWCLQHLSDKDLIAFLHRSKAALKDEGDEKGLIVVKENVCKEEEDGSEHVWYDDEDHSITRSTKAYERVFKEAGMEIVRCDVQQGLPEELFTVKIFKSLRTIDRFSGVGYWISIPRMFNHAKTRVAVRSISVRKMLRRD